MHEGMVYSPVTFGEYPSHPPVREDGGRLYVDVKGLLDAVERDFNEYVAQIRVAGPLRDAFAAKWSEYWDKARKSDPG